MVSGRTMRLQRAGRERNCMKDPLEEAGQSWGEMRAGRGLPSVLRARAQDGHRIHTRPGPQGER